MPKFLNLIINWLFPEKCLICNCEVFEKAVFCPKCFSALTFIDRPICQFCGKMLALDIDDITYCETCMNSKNEFDFCRSLLVYNLFSKKLIMKIKKNADRHIAKKCCSMIEMRYNLKSLQADFIIPIPSHWTRVLKRGYNPATIIAAELSKILQIPMNTKILKRTRKTEYQKNKSIAERKENVKNAFSCSGNVSGKVIILLDDVYTTGATLNECAKVIKSSEAKAIYCITIATTENYS
ncbi:MAG: ComF family protein [Holosporales bacterium]|nr:ComF family protein [Holosporales bacterium]